MKVPAKAILALMDFYHGEGSFEHETCEAFKALIEFSAHVDTMALAVMAEEHGELEIRPR